MTRILRRDAMAIAHEALALLHVARRMNNQTVTESIQVHDWHQRVDRLFEKYGQELSPEDRWDDPKRVEHRAFVDQLFRRGK